MTHIYFSKDFSKSKNDSMDIIFICDHASNFIPERYYNLGLSKIDLDTHIAYDIGAKNLTVNLAQTLHQNYFISNFSRLLIDPNRDLKDDSLILSDSFGTKIPGNKEIDIKERKLRIKQFHTPYHRGLSKFIEKKIGKSRQVVLISIHSFSKVTPESCRSIEVGLLYNKNIELLLPIQKQLLKMKVHVGRNYPYSGFHFNYTLDKLAENFNLNSISIEIRNDLICSQKGITRYVNIFEKIFRGLLNVKQRRQRKN